MVQANRSHNVYKLFRPEMLENPYPFYHQLRSEDPVHWESNLGVWILTRYADIVAALHDRRLSSDRIGSLEKLREMGLEAVIPIFRTLSDMMLFSNPPKHTRLRALSKRAFTPQSVEPLRALIQEIVDLLIDQVQKRAGKRKNEMDVIRDLAYPLPTVVIGQMLDIPTKDRDQFRQWWYDVMAFLKNAHTQPELHHSELERVTAMTDYLRSVFARVRNSPRENLLNTLVAEHDGDRLSEEELFANSILILS